MAITDIVRDLLDSYIVRINATDTLAQVAATGYITAQIPNTTSLNHGVWEWVVGDVVLVKASDGSQLFRFIASDFATLSPMSLAANAVNGLVALAGGAQAGTALTGQINRVTTVATAADSVQLPLATAGLYLTVINAAAVNALAIFPRTGQSINALAPNASFSLVANKTVNFYCGVNGIWNTLLSA